MNTTVDWKETPETHVFKTDILGLKKDEVKVEVEDNRVLQISEEKNVEKEDKPDKWHRVLPENAKVDQIKAAMANGVLSVIVPKTEVKKPDVKAVEINGYN
ncbi:hypothetical protein ACFX2G_006202 [Malus domestica]